MSGKPIENSYWVVPGKFLAGEYPGDRDRIMARARLEALVRAGITCFVDLTSREDFLEPYEPLFGQIDGAKVRRLAFPVEDVSVPRSLLDTVAVLDAIDDALRRGEGVYVHCWGGIGRTGIIVGCWLARHGLSGRDALARLKTLYADNPNSAVRTSPETPAQEDYILRWREDAPDAVVSRTAGALLGLAAGDALGTTVEFEPPGSFEPLTDIVGGGPFRLKPGEWTDDTSMALCLVDSLLHSDGFDPRDQMDRYVRWWKEGYLGSNGTCFDIGGTTSDALARYRETGEWLAGSTHPRSAGNGCLMRLAPVPLFFAADPATAIRLSGLSAKTTHGLLVCVDACRYLGALLVGAVSGESRETLLSERYTPVPGFWDANPLHPEVDAVARGSFKRKEPPAIKGSGYVVASLEAALWAFHRARDFREGCLAAVNLGDDADTTGAIYGQLAGAHFGVEGIPAEWRHRLAHGKMIYTFARLLAARRHKQ